MDQSTQVNKIGQGMAYLEMRGESKLLASPDEPLGRIILIPLDRISVVHGELVMEVVVTFPNGDKCSNQVIARSVLVVKRCLTQPVSEGVDTKCGLQKMLSRHIQRFQTLT